MHVTDFLFGVLLVLTKLDPLLCEVYVIVPLDEHPSCDGKCFTLSQFTVDSNRNISSNTTLLISPGVHFLDGELSVSNIAELSLQSHNGSNDTIIECSDRAMFTFSHIERIYVSGLTLSGCDNTKFDSADQLVITNSNFVGRNNTNSALTINESVASLNQSSFLSNVVFNPSATDQIKSGGALSVIHSKVSIVNCIFNGNTANSGGAVLSDSGSSITVNSTVFSSNYAVDCKHDVLCGYGGALYVEGGSAVYVNNSTFLNNTADKSGGMAILYNSNLSLSNSCASNNSAAYYGGTLAAYRSSNLIFDTATLMYGNVCLDGGAVFLHDSILKSEDCTFSHNTAGRNGGSISLSANSFITIRNSSIFFNVAEMGGAISVHQGSSVAFENSIFSHNSANKRGGLLFIDSDCAVIVKYSSIEYNQALHGAAFYLNSATSLQLQACRSEQNLAGDSGGVVYAENSATVNMTRSLFSHNRANSRGGIISVCDYSTTVIDQCNFTSNSAKDRGGVISVRGNGASVFINCSNFDSNEVDVYGGVAHLIGNGLLRATNSVFANNCAGLNGGVINCYFMARAEVYGSAFISNNATSYGGVVYLMDRSSFFAQESVFRKNIGSDLGAVVMSVSGSSTTIHNSYITQNSATLGGVIVAIRWNVITIVNTVLANNTARIHGGTLYVRSMGIVSIIHCKLLENQARSDGVVVIFEQSSLTVTNTVFDRNMAGHDGGVIYVYNNSTLKMENCSASSNFAGNSGGLVYGLKDSDISVRHSRADINQALQSGGVFHVQQGSKITVTASNFTRNKANYGGVVRVFVCSSVNIVDSVFVENAADISGGVIAIYKTSSATVNSSYFSFNRANFGGVFYLFQNNPMRYSNNLATVFLHFNSAICKSLETSNVKITYSTFSNNSADLGGVLYMIGGEANISSSSVHQSSARYAGGAISILENGAIYIASTSFAGNTAGSKGGALALVGNCVVAIKVSEFAQNRATIDGGVIHLQQSNASVYGCNFTYSNASRDGGVMTVIQGTTRFDECIFVNNNAAYGGGVVHAHNTSLTVTRCTFEGNKATRDSGGVLYLTDTSRSTIQDSISRGNSARGDGGVVSASSSSTVDIKASSFYDNHANRGGAFAASRQSSLSFPAHDLNESNSRDKAVIHGNQATSGGGVYLSDSHLLFGSEAIVYNNTANEWGGGVCADNSFISINGTILFDSNVAMLGGGVNLQNSRISMDGLSMINFTSNQAGYGGALHVNDERQNVCSRSMTDIESSRCFFESLSTNFLLNFCNNSAKYSGHDLYGGLLDRCSTIVNKNSSAIEMNGAARFEEISSISNFATISSKPVRVCICIEDFPDCGKQNHRIQVKEKNKFRILVAAVDHVNHTLAATIHSNFEDLGITARETVQRITAKCSYLDYQVTFPRVNEAYKLNVYAEGPCSGHGISSLPVSINVASCSCPPGFFPADRLTKCVCDCDYRFDMFSLYISECDVLTGRVIKRGSFWITYIPNGDFFNGTTSPYFIHPYCPLDYCQPPNIAVPIDFSVLNGEDVQCANNRGGVLCGLCRTNYSLSLGSSKCIECPDDWYGQFVAIIVSALIAGILLVFLLLMLNVTVAVGTINSIIFYANIINAKRSIYINQPHLTFVPVFISWLNLEIGFDTCFFEGMDTYWKTWIELAFPLYIIFLVVLIIGVSSCSSRFSKLIGRRNPVATLATLILLSYSRLLQTVIATFSFVTLAYPNGTTVTAWLPDANVLVANSKLKLAALICLAVAVLAIGLWYTFMIFSWQWLLHFSRSKCFKWTRNNKLHFFIDTYHTPYMAKHRYWTGLLLLVRVVIYLISGISAANEQPITLLSTVAIMCFLLLYRSIVAVRLYRLWTLHVIESFMLFNTAVFALITMYAFNHSQNYDSNVIQYIHQVAAYLSVGSTSALLVTIIIYHIYRYGNSKLYSLLYAKTRRREVSTTFDDSASPRDNCRNRLLSSDSRLLEVLDSPRTVHASPFIRFKSVEHNSLTTTDIVNKGHQLSSNGEAQNSL